MCGYFCMHLEVKQIILGSIPVLGYAFTQWEKERENPLRK